MSWFRVILYVLTLRCEEADRVRSVSRSGAPLRRGARFGEWAHSMLCKNCRHARARLRELDTLVAELRDEPDATPAGPMPPDARERIAKSLDEAREKLD